MNTPLLRPGRFLTAVLVFVFAQAAAFAAPAAVIYSAKSGLLAGWGFNEWGGLVVEPTKAVAREAGGGALLVRPTEVAAPYAGMQLIADGDGIDLSDTLRSGGEVHLYLRNGHHLDGAAAGEQRVQAMLSFQPEEGKAFNGAYQHVLLDPVSADGKASTDWKLVKLSIPAQVRGRAEAGAALKLRGVYVQYIDKPDASYFVGECIVVAGAAK